MVSNRPDPSEPEETSPFEDRIQNIGGMCPVERRGRKRIKIFFPIYGLEGGGAERVVTTLIHHLNRTTFEPVLVLLHTGGAYLTQVPPDVKVVELYKKRSGKEEGSGQGNGRTKRWIKDTLWAPRRRRMLTHSFEDAAVWMYIRYHTRVLRSPFEDAIEKEKPDAIVANLLLANALALSVGPGRGIYTTVCVHNTLDDYQARVEYKNSPLQRADAIIAVSQTIGSLFQRKFGEEKVHVIHNPHDIEKMGALSREEVSHPWFREKDLPILVGIGRLCHQKNFSLLVEAVSELNRSRETPVRLAIFGEGPERKGLERLVKRRGEQSRIRFMGWVPNPFKYLARADLFVLSSNWEGLPNTLIEAMACGVPVVSTDCGGGPGEILQEGALGTLVRCGDRAGLKDAILEVLQDVKKSRMLREKGRERALDFGVASQLSLYEDLIIRGVEKKERHPG